MKNKKKISFNIDENIHLRAKQLALDKRTTVSELYNEWIKNGVENLEKKI